jgi:hypothetical protein
LRLQRKSPKKAASYNQTLQLETASGLTFVSVTIVAAPGRPARPARRLVTLRSCISSRLTERPALILPTCAPCAPPGAIQRNPAVNHGNDSTYAIAQTLFGPTFVSTSLLLTAKRRLGRSDFTHESRVALVNSHLEAVHGNTDLDLEIRIVATERTPRPIARRQNNSKSQLAVGPNSVRAMTSASSS